jgi:hypothetical protein
VVQPASAATLFAQLYPKTGEVRLQNRDLVAPAAFVFYSITSPSGALNGSPNVWKSITDNYDAPFGSSPGNGLLDPNGEWIEISSAATQLAEGALDADGGMIPSLRSVSLGRIWNLNARPNPDFTFAATALDGQPIAVSTVYAVDGDYLPDGVVNQLDYQLWRQFYGSRTALLADGNLNGIVDVADYVIWRDNLGMSVPSPTIGALSAASLAVPSSGTVVPEPTSAALLLTALTGLFLGLRAGRRKKNDE